MSFLIEVFPTTATNGRICRLLITGSALVQENRPRTLAWVAGFKAIEALSTNSFLKSVRPSNEVIELPPIGSGELASYVTRVLSRSRAWLATKCPQCETVTAVPGEDLRALGLSRAPEDQRLVLKCPSGHSFDESQKNLLVLVKYLGTRLGSSMAPG